MEPREGTHPTADAEDTERVDYTWLAYTLERIAEEFPSAVDFKPVLTDQHPETDILVEVRIGHGRLAVVVP